MPELQPGERRQVSVLFCDIVGFTSLSTTIDQDELLELINTYYELGNQVIQSFQGSIADYLGDGIMAYFGYPLTGEEAACNAVRAALKLSETLTDIESLPGQPIQTRIGIATGVVIVRDFTLGLQATKSSLVGETPNLAARLQTVAQPNHVVISKRTKNITEGVFDYSFIGKETLKGFSDPVEVYEVHGAKHVGSRSQVRAETEGSLLIGREKELNVLRSQWDRTKHGQSTLALLQGDAGIGKSRLVEAMRREIVGNECKIVNWFCSPNASTIALHPIAEQLARSAGFGHGDDQQTRHKKLDTLLEKYGVLDLQSQEILEDLMGLAKTASTTLAALTADKRKEIRLRALLGMLETWAGRDLFMIVVEDLHWVDPTTLELLDQIIKSQRLGNWLILTTARPEFEPHWSMDYLHLRVGRLDAIDSIRLCQELCLTKEFSTEQARRIVSHCDGNPLFVEEVTKSVIESLSKNSERDDISTITIPETLHDSLVARLDLLGSARRVASVGAVIGRKFGIEILEAVSEMPKDELLHDLESLVDSEIIQPEGSADSSDYTFKHALIRDTAYDILLKRDRQKLHQTIADILKKQFQEVSESEPQMLAYHFTKAGNLVEAVPFWISAATKMAGDAAHAEAVSHYQQALDLISAIPVSRTHRSRNSMSTSVWP